MKYMYINFTVKVIKSYFYSFVYGTAIIHPLGVMDEVAKVIMRRGYSVTQRSPAQSMVGGRNGVRLANVCPIVQEVILSKMYFHFEH